MNRFPMLPVTLLPGSGFATHASTHDAGATAAETCRSDTMAAVEVDPHRRILLATTQPAGRRPAEAGR